MASNEVEKLIEEVNNLTRELAMKSNELTIVTGLNDSLKIFVIQYEMKELFAELDIAKNSLWFMTNDPIWAI